MTLNKPNPRLAILRAQLAAEADAIKLQRFRYKMSNAIGCSCPVPAPDADSLPLPPSYWEDLEHWLKTLAPAKPAAPALAAGCAHEWVRGIDLPLAERFGLWHYRADQWHKPGNVFDAIEIDDDGEYRRAAHGAKLGDRYDESKYATADLTARLASTSSADGAETHLVPDTSALGLRHLVCVVARSMNTVGTVLAYESTAAALVDRSLMRSGSDYRLCDKDGWIPHAPTADAVCPVPPGVHFEILLFDGGCQLDGGYGGTGDCNFIKWDAGTSVIAWRPITDDRK